MKKREERQNGANGGSFDQGGGIIPAPVETGLSGAVSAPLAGFAGQSARAVMPVRPRDPKAVMARLMREARHGGERFFYRWTVRLKDGTTDVIEGPSVRLMLAAARAYGNVATQVSVDSEDADSFTLRATAVDLESSFAVERLFRQSKRVPGTRSMHHDRALDIAFQIGQSKALRNALGCLLPDGLIQAAMAEAKKAAATRATGGRPVAERATPDALAALVRGFAALGVSRKMITRRVGKPLTELTGADVADLQGILTAIEEGQTSIANEFPVAPETGEPAANGEVAAAMKNRERMANDLLKIGDLFGYSAEQVQALAEQEGVDLANLTRDDYQRLVAAMERGSAGGEG